MYANKITWGFCASFPSRPLLPTSFLVWGVILSILSSCASYKTQYASETEGGAKDQYWPEQDLIHRIYLVGNAGEQVSGMTPPVLNALENHLQTAGSKSTVLFLGNNTYPKGLVSKSNKELRNKAEAALNAQLKILENYRGAAYFLPGERDWSSGRKSLERQENYVEEHLNKLNGIEDKDDWSEYWLPDDACPGPEVVEINDFLVLVIFDSQWWLTKWDDEPDMHDGCNIRSREFFAFYLEEALRKHRHKNVIVASHHGFDSYGPHGGYHHWSSHLFPLRETNLKSNIPLPVIGSLMMWIRSSLGGRQDLSNGNYQNLVGAMMHAARKNGEYIFVSGNESSQQYIHHKGQHQIISGAASETTPTFLTRNAEFTSSSQGFAELGVTDKGEVYVRFWSVQDGNEAVLYSKKLKDALPALAEPEPEIFSEYPVTSSTVTTKVVNYDISAGNAWKNFWLGEHYRDMYLEKYNFPVLDLARFDGGLRVKKRGGGNQTNSLRLVNEDGRIYNLRSVTKDPSRLLPYPFNRISLAENLIVDNFLSTHAFAAVAVSHLARAAGVYYSLPKLYYMPKQPALGSLNKDFGGEVYLLEERIDDVYSDRENFGFPQDIESTGDVVEELMKNQHARVNQEQALRSRLFDLMIGDWDRHDDQWKWAVHYEDEEPVFSPIPRDRDQSFSKYDGFVAFMARQFPDGFLHQLRPYSRKIKDVRWAGWSARYFDRSFLNELSWEDWQKIILEIQTGVSDSVIEDALSKWPAKARNLTEAEIVTNLKYRRDNLMKIGRDFYDFLALEVDVVGSENKELFEIEYLENEDVVVKTWDSNKDGDKQKLLYQRKFHAKETREIHIYGMDDKDIFKISGRAKKSPLIRMVGGLDEDQFISDAKISGLRKKHWVYDDIRDENHLQGASLRDKRSSNWEDNVYDRKAAHYNYDVFFALPLISYNVENGLQMGATGQWTTYKFKKAPYSSLQSFSIAYSFGSNTPNLEYDAEFLERLGELDLNLNTYYHGRRFATNYFGLGNETAYEKELDFYGISQEVFQVFPALQLRHSANLLRFRLGPKLLYTNLLDKSAMYLNTVDAEEENFSGHWFLGPRFEMEWDGRDSKLFPRRGGRFQLYGEWANDLEDSDNTYTHGANLHLYLPVDKGQNLIFATRLGYGFAWGDYEFFQAPSLGERSTSLGQEGSLRGYPFDRFRGDSKFYHNTDLRWRMIQYDNSVIPVSIGIYGGFDYGRVWFHQESSDKWHSAYGGGLWLAPLDYLVFSTGVFQSPNDLRYYLSLGFPF